MQAKYKVKSDNEDDEILYYCFECAGPLVNQGFEVDLLTLKDKEAINKQKGMQFYSKKNQRMSETSEKKDF